MKPKDNRYRLFHLKKALRYITITGCALLISGAGRRPPKPLIPTARRIERARYTETGKDLTAVFIDVGQGNAILVKSPSGKTLLYDAGASKENLTADILPVLKKYRIEKLDYMIASHAHTDHIACMADILKNVRVKKYLDSGYEHPSDDYMELLEAVRENKVKYDVLTEGWGNLIKLGKNIDCSIFNPPKGGYQGKNCNDSSVMLKISYKEVSILFAGDCETPVENRAVKQYGRELMANVIQVGHHGSDTSSCENFLGAVMPEVAVVPVGRNNSYGHPSAKAIERIKKSGADVYLLFETGNLLFKTEGRRFFIEPEPV